MVWWGRRKDDPPTAVPPPLPAGKAAPAPPVFTPGVQADSNIVSFPDQRNKQLSDANRSAVHALLDELLDRIGPNEYLVMGIEAEE